MELLNIKEIPAEMATPEILGGKGWGLWYMQQAGVSVPPAFIIPTTACGEYKTKPKTTMKAISGWLGGVLNTFKKDFGYIPLLSIRSGARVSMPGMMDTILNVGLDDDTMPEWTNLLGAACVADSYRRLVTMYGSVVKGLDRHELESHESCEAIRGYYTRKTDEAFPKVKDQILGSIEAVFKSWDNSRAKFYRKANNIPEEWGTAVVIQAMVFGNLNDNSGTGVLFTRNPDTGAKELKGEFLINAQGEDVVAGIRTPMPLHKMLEWNNGVALELQEAVLKLETSRKDVQDVEFTIQDGKLFILQTRNAKRSAGAAVQIALDMHSEGLIDAKTAIKRVSPRQFDEAGAAILDPKFTTPPYATGIPACTGVATGKPVFSAQAAIDCKEPCILVTQETTPDDIAGMAAAKGVLTMTGGATSHAAVVARGMDKACVVGLSLDLEVFKNAPVISIDGKTGRVWLGEVPVVDGSANPSIGQYRKLVSETLGIIPANTKAIKGTESMLLDVGGSLSNLTGVMEAVMEAMETVSGTVFLDCRATGRTASEASISNMFCPLPPVEAEKYLLECLEKMLQPDEKERIKVLTNAVTTLPTLGLANNLRSLILSDGILALESGQSLNAADPAVAKVLGWLGGEGIEFLNLGFLGSTGKSVLSPEAALQAV